MSAILVFAFGVQPKNFKLKSPTLFVTVIKIQLDIKNSFDYIESENENS